MVAPAHTPERLIAELTAAGVRLEARGIRLVVDAPRGVLTPELKAALLLDKVRIIAAHPPGWPMRAVRHPEFVDVPIHDGRSRAETVRGAATRWVSRIGLQLCKLMMRAWWGLWVLPGPPRGGGRRLHRRSFSHAPLLKMAVSKNRNPQGITVSTKKGKTGSKEVAQQTAWLRSLRQSPAAFLLGMQTRQLRDYADVRGTRTATTRRRNWSTGGRARRQSRSSCRSTTWSV